MKKLLMVTILTAATVPSTGCMCNGPLMRWAQSHNAWLCGSNQYGGYQQQCAPACCEQTMSNNCCAPAVSNCAPAASSNCCTPAVGNYAPATGTVVTPVPGNTYTP